MSARLTEKKLEDYRFRRNEEAIFEAFFVKNADDKSGVSKVVRAIGVSRATFYRHHGAVSEIVEDYERYILRQYDRLVEEMRGKSDLGLRQRYYRMLVFILQNRRIFQVLLERRNLKVIIEMVYMLRNEIEAEAKLLSKSKRIFRVYVGEMVGLISDWGLEGFKGSEMVKLLNNIMYLTETMRKRLLPLAD